MSFWDNLKKLTKPYAEDEYDDYDEETEGYEAEELEVEEEAPRRNRRSPFASGRTAEAEPVVEAITPVPGGVGAVTTAVLMSHVVEAAGKR